MQLVSCDVLILSTSGGLEVDDCDFVGVKSADEVDTPVHRYAWCDVDLDLLAEAWPHEYQPSGKGQLARSNAEQVAKIRRILEDQSLEVATPAEARAMLALKGGDRVEF